MHLLGVLFNRMGKHEKAMKMIVSALRVRRRIHGEDSAHLQVLNSMLAIGKAHYYMGQLEDAMHLFRTVCDVRIERLGVCHESVAEAFHCTALVLKERTQYQPAIDILLEVLALRRKRIGTDSEEVVDTLNTLTSVYFRNGERDKALSSCEEALSIASKHLGHNNIKVSACKKNLGDIYLDQGEYEKAMDVYTESLRICELWGDQSLDVGDTWNNIGNTCFKAGDYERAKNAFKNVSTRNIFLLATNYS
jgi:tetratricopeptide (TPR) repeat protein